MVPSTIPAISPPERLLGQALLLVLPLEEADWRGMRVWNPRVSEDGIGAILIQLLIIAS